MNGGTEGNCAAAFEGFVRPRVVFGAGSIERIAAVAAETTPRNILVVTDPGIVAAGHVGRVVELLKQGTSARIHVFDGVHENPDSELVAECARFAASVSPDLLIGLGGGSSLDTAKGCNFVLTNGGVMQDYWGYGKADKPMLPLIAVPTTAGTGSETQSYALIADARTHQKMACGDPKAAARAAILDPALTLSMPRAVAARTGLDTVTHAVETAVTRRRNAFSSLFSREAFCLAHESLPRVLEEPADVAARGRMLLASAYAGIAIETSMLGAAHSLANPLTARFNLFHGQAVGMMLPAVVQYNAEDPAAAEIYAGLARAGGLCDDSTSTAAAVQRLIHRLRLLLQRCQMPGSLRDCGIEESDLDALSLEAARQWTAQFNPRPVTAADLRALYAAAL